MRQRIIWDSSQRNKFFDDISLKSGLNWRVIAESVGVNPRTLCDWRLGKTKLPLVYYKRLASEYNVSLPDGALIVDENVYRSAAARVGALARMELYGPPGTPEGRSKGGKASMARMRERGKVLTSSKCTTTPKYSEDLAEFIGIILGDGHVSKFQVSAYGCWSTDRDYCYYVKRLGESLFGVEGKVFIRKDADCWNVIFSSVELVKYLSSHGLRPGNKMCNMATIPGWIMDEPKYSLRAICGLFDTDGCVYLDKHNINGRIYYSLGVAITSYIPNLFAAIQLALKNNGFSPTISVRRNLLLRKRDDIKRFFVEVAPANTKHLRRYKKFTKLCGEVR